MTIHYSIVIPAYNRSEQLKLSLLSFEHQDFPMDQFEIIVVNDGSNDETEAWIGSYTPPYRLKYLNNGSQKGVSYTRNNGAKASSGQYIIFCDADFIVLPGYLKTFDRYQSMFKDSVITGFPENVNDVFTHFYPEFEGWEVDLARDILTKAEMWSDHYLTVSEKVPIITPANLKQDIHTIDNFLIHWGNFQRDKKEEYRKQDTCRWMLFVTRSISMPKDIFMAAGGFDEKFIVCEDWELGYRLDKMGVSFIPIQEEIGFHQFHPQVSRERKQHTPLLKLLYGKHGTEDIELNLMSVFNPVDDIFSYKNTIRSYYELKGSSVHKDMADTLYKTSVQRANSHL